MFLFLHAASFLSMIGTCFFFHPFLSVLFSFVSDLCRLSGWSPVDCMTLRNLPENFRNNRIKRNKIITYGLSWQLTTLHPAVLGLQCSFCFLQTFLALALAKHSLISALLPEYRLKSLINNAVKKNKANHLFAPPSTPHPLGRPSQKLSQ